MRATSAPGQSVTALYEVVPVGGPRTMRRSALRDAGTAAPAAGGSTELGFVKIRYKLPKSDTSRLITTPIDRRSEVRQLRGTRRAMPASRPASPAFAELLRGGRYTRLAEL